MEFLTSWAHANAIVVSAAILIVAYIFIATEKIPKMTVALVGASLTLFLGLLIVGCGSKATIKLSQSEIKMYVGEMYDIYPVVTGVEGNDAVKRDDETAGYLKELGIKEENIFF